MVTTDALFDFDLYREMYEAKYIREQWHLDLSLVIANYTEKAQYDNLWNEVTRQCRGLIYNPVTREIVARPYSKFFNYGDTQAPAFDLDEPAVITDKLDGSLGISYPTPDGPAIATRGSFTSSQAVHATALLREKYPDWIPVEGCTFLFEIIYPSNRIVLDYDGVDDLVLHGVIGTRTGASRWVQALGWPGPLVERLTHRTLREALAAEPRTNAEGIVARFTDGRMVKIKQDDYVAMHKIVTGLNERAVWQWLADGKPLGEMLATLPDELHSWTRNVATELLNAKDIKLLNAHRAYVHLLRGLPALHSRGDFAREAVDHSARAYLFLLLDDKRAQAEELAWRDVKPAGEKPYPVLDAAA